MKYVNTGKILIGVAFQAPPQPITDRDALRLQRALLGERERTDWDGDGLAIVGIVIAVGIAALAFL